MSTTDKKPRTSPDRAAAHTDTADTEVGHSHSAEPEAREPMTTTDSDEHEQASEPSLQGRSLLLGGLLGLGLAAAGLITYSAMHKTPPTVIEPTYVVDVAARQVRLKGSSAERFETTVVQPGRVLPRPPVTARVAAIETKTAPSFAPLEGRVEQVAVRLGDKVIAGAKLLLVRSGELATMLRELRQSEASVQTKRALTQRMGLLVESRAASPNELLVAQNDLREAELSVQAADSRLKSLLVQKQGDNLYWVLAAQAGTVVQLDAVPGQHVEPSAERPVATVANLDEVLVLADVPPLDAKDLQVAGGAEVWLPSDSGVRLQGIIETVSQLMDAERQTVPIRIRVKNAEHVLRPNSFVEASFPPSGKKQAILVPTEAVVSDGLVSVVFVQTAPGVFQRRQVTVGRNHEGQTEILGGLSAGDRIVHRGAILLLNSLSLVDDDDDSSKPAPAKPSPGEVKP